MPASSPRRNDAPESSWKFTVNEGSIVITRFHLQHTLHIICPTSLIHLLLVYPSLHTAQITYNMVGGSSKEMSTLDASDPQRKAQLKRRSAQNWNLKAPDQGPASLAVKNRMFRTHSFDTTRSFTLSRLHRDDRGVCRHCVVHDLRPRRDQVGLSTSSMTCH